MPSDILDDVVGDTGKSIGSVRDGKGKAMIVVIPLFGPGMERERSVSKRFPFAHVRRKWEDRIIEAIDSLPSIAYLGTCYCL